MKQLSFNRVFTVQEPTDDYGELVNRTAGLIKKSFVVTLKMVESWEPSYTASLYDDCMTKWRNKGYTSPSHMWWTERGKKIGKTFTSKKK